MLKQALMTLILSLNCISTFATNCPSANDIKKNQLQGWKLYDTDDNKPLSIKRASAFKKNVNAFAMAEWTNESNHTGAVQCHYRDKDGSDMEAYLAKPHFNLGQNKQFWYEVNGHMQCAANADHCNFSSAPIMQAQLNKINS